MYPQIKLDHHLFRMGASRIIAGVVDEATVTQTRERLTDLVF